jgi:capsular exopolysaccharide synthesis family protein
MATAKTNTSNSALRRVQTDDSLSIMDMLMLCLRHWPWFILSFVLCMGAATLYLLSTPKTYTRTTSILVKSSGEKSTDIKLIEDLGVNNFTSNISDEIVAIHSPAVVYDLVKRLHLDFSYFRSGFFRDEPLYAESLPVEVELPDLDDNATASFTLTLNGDETATLSKIVRRGESVDSTCRVKIGKSEKTPLGAVTVKPTLYYKEGSREEILVRRTGFIAAAGRYGGLITAALQPNTRNIIDITCVDNSIPRAENILKTIVNIYNENWVQNRNQVSVSTNEFIKERLGVIENELGDVEGDIAAYKSSHGMLSVEQAAGQAVSKEAASDAERQQINNQLYMIRYVRNYVADPSHAKQLIPAGTGIGNGAIEAQIAEYNTRVLERNNLVSNSSEHNPLVGDIDVTLGNLRGAILKSLDNAQMTLNAQLSSVQAVHGQALSRLSAAPQQQNHLLSFERQQKVKESLYLFLLQKREENELSQAFTAYNTRIIAEPWGSSQPSSPDQNRILLMAFAIALAIPAAFFILREMSNSKVRGRKDLENLTIPYVGELPLWKPKKDEKAPEEGYRFVVHQHSRDITNEAYRVVRTNLEFMTNEEKKCKIIMLTSFNPGSGKTFICGNIGVSFAIRNSRVICIDLDLRRGSLSEFVGSPKHGLTSYLSGHVDDYQSLIVHHPLGALDDKKGGADDAQQQTIDFLPMGKIPPNPTELLYSPKLKPMLDELRQHYDYIFVDCPPVEIVADATIISHEADVTLFVVRAGLLERSMLPELQKNYDEKKYNNMAMILNGTDAEHHYGYHRYGYGYGRYGYGKRYGYGYYGSDSKGKKRNN